MIIFGLFLKWIKNLQIILFKHTKNKTILNTQSLVIRLRKQNKYNF